MLATTKALYTFYDLKQFVNLSTTDSLHPTILCCGDCPALCRMFSSILASAH